MKTKKSWKIGSKLVAKCVCILSAILIAAFAVIILETANSSKQSAINNITALAKGDAATIRAKLEVPLDTARALAQCMQGYKDVNIENRRIFFNSLMRNLLEENEDFLGVWTCWEPNALDGLDPQMMNADGSDKSGRFLPYWYRSGDEITLTTLVDYNTEGVGDYYLLAKNSGQETILEPYEYEIDGQRVLLTTLSIPVRDEKGNIIAVTGVDLALNDLQGISFENGGYSSINTYLLSNSGTYVITPDGDALGTSLTDNGQPDAGAIAAAIAQGQVYQHEGVSHSTGAQVQSIYYPVTIGNTATPWSAAIDVDTSEVMAATTQMSVQLFIILGALLAVIVVSLLLIVKASISKPIRETAELAKALASGRLDEPVVIKANDEIGELKGILDNQVRGAFKAIETAQIKAKKQSVFSREHINKLVVNLERLSKGELYCDMSVGETDQDIAELHELYQNISDNLHKTVNAINGYIKEISLVLGEIADKNLSVGISSEYLGDFVALKDSINRITTSLSEVMTDINTSADQVASGTQQVSGSSQEISQGAAEQASAIEQLTATITQISDQTRLNAQSANEANRLTADARRGAEQGNEHMKAMQQAMEEINESSASISKIIKVIDDIAFQTNILALNAAVEAARAGVHGKGFAVVAEEVRNLAARSANAAKETTDLIEGSIRRAEAGTRIADETAGALADIVNGVEKAAQLVGEIAQASGEQASAIMQVNHGIEQMSQVVQTNSATSEEAAAAAEELSSQAELLKQMISQFQLKDAAEGRIPRALEKAPSETPVAVIDLSDHDFGKY